jgi:hypothetical protein
VRVLFISDVYFPRANGVSTSIRTFRQDLANCGVETVLVAPRYDANEPGQPDDESVAGDGNRFRAQSGLPPDRPLMTYRPVVSTAELGPRSILKPGSGALVVEEKRDEFAAAIVRVLQDEKLQRDLGERGRAYVKSWSSASMARRLTDLYHTIRLAPKASRAVA